MSDEAEMIDMDIFEKDFIKEINSPHDQVQKIEKKISRSTFEYYYSNIFPFKYFFKWLSNEKTGILYFIQMFLKDENLLLHLKVIFT